MCVAAVGVRLPVINLLAVHFPLLTFRMLDVHEPTAACARVADVVSGMQRSSTRQLHRQAAGGGFRAAPNRCTLTVLRPQSCRGCPAYAGRPSSRPRGRQASPTPAWSVASLDARAPRLPEALIGTPGRGSRLERVATTHYQFHRAELMLLTQLTELLRLYIACRDFHCVNRGEKHELSMFRG